MLLCRVYPNLKFAFPLHLQQHPLSAGPGASCNAQNILNGSITWWGCRKAHESDTRNTSLFVRSGISLDNHLVIAMGEQRNLVCIGLDLSRSLVGDGCCAFQLLQSTKTPSFAVAHCSRCTTFSGQLIQAHIADWLTRQQVLINGRADDGTRSCDPNEESRKRDSSRAHQSKQSSDCGIPRSQWQHNLPQWCELLFYWWSSCIQSRATRVLPSLAAARCQCDHRYFYCRVRAPEMNYERIALIDI